MGGMTPELFSFRGRCDASPPNILLPTWRLGYWTMMRRWARSMNTMKPITPATTTIRARITHSSRAPVRPSSRVPTSAEGSRATMPLKMINEVPLPTPRWVICSPSHIRKIVPQVSEITVVT